MTILSVVFVNSGFTAYCIYMHNLDFHKLMDWQGYIVCTTANLCIPTNLPEAKSRTNFQKKIT